MILSGQKLLRHFLKCDSATPLLASAHLQWWAQLLGGYEYSIEYRPGKHHANADFLSRMPLADTPSSVPEMPETVLLMETLDSSPITAAQVKLWIARVYQKSKMQLYRVVWIEMIKSLSPYSVYEHELSVDDSVLRRNCVIFHPAGREKVIDLLHEGHLKKIA